jgi:uncharacterized protein YegP (UPF0339 family)
MNIFTITTDHRGGYQFALVGTGGRMLMRSIKFNEKKCCHERILDVCRNLDSDSCFELWRTPNGNYYFYFYDAQGFVIATSDVFTSLSEQFDAMASIRDMAMTPHIADVSDERITRIVKRRKLQGPTLT